MLLRTLLLLIPYSSVSPWGFIGLVGRRGTNTTEYVLVPDGSAVGSSSVMLEVSSPIARSSALNVSQNSVEFCTGMGLSFSSRTDAGEKGNKKSPPSTESLCRTPLPQWGRVVSSGHLQRRRLPGRVTGLRASPTARYAIRLLPTRYHTFSQNRTVTGSPDTKRRFPKPYPSIDLITTNHQTPDTDASRDSRQRPAALRPPANGHRSV